MRGTATTAAGKRRASARTGRARPAARTAKTRAPSRPSRRRSPSRSRSPSRRRAPSRPRSKSRALRTATALVGALSGRRRVTLIALLAGALVLTYFGWFRDSSLVAVEEVEVKGVSSTDRQQIVAELTDTAQRMTTLHVQTDRLVDAVREFPAVASVVADASFPHGLTIQVIEHPPTAIARAGDRQVPIAADGSLLPGVKVGDQRLAELRVDELPTTGQLSGDSLSEALAIGAAPAPLRPLIAGASVSRDYGTLVSMRGGIEVRFGTRHRAHQKWVSVAAILADPKLTSLTYVDVRVPDRPAVGGASTAAATTTP